MLYRLSSPRAPLLLLLLILTALACNISFDLFGESKEAPTATRVAIATNPPPPTQQPPATQAPSTIPAASSPTSASPGSIIASAVMARESTPLTLGPKGVTDVFAADHKVYHAVVTTKDAPAGTSVKVVWMGVDSGENLGDHTLRAEGSQNLDFTYTTGATGLTPGKYKVDVYLNGALDRTLNFTVATKETKLPATPTPKPLGQCPPPPAPNYKPPLIATKITMAKGTTGSQLDPQNPTRIFDLDDVFYAIVHVENAPANTKIKAVWFAQDVGDAEPCNVQITAASEITTSGTRNLSFSLRPRPKWLLGVYHVYIYANDNLNIDVDFRVQ
jgi:hypothetical protein